jgi:hypothetical protein
MKRMLGFLPAAPELGVGESCAWAGATALKSAAVAISSHKPLSIKFRFIFGFLVIWFWVCSHDFSPIVPATLFA